MGHSFESRSIGGILCNYPIPRWWESDATIDAKNIQWHFLADACLTGYGAVVYRRAVSPSGDIFVTIIMSRAHVVPLDSSKASHHGSIVNLEMVSNVNQIDCRKFLLKALGALVGPLDRLRVLLKAGQGQNDMFPNVYGQQTFYDP